MSIEELPIDTIYVILEFLTIQDWFRISQVSKNSFLSKSARSDRIWKNVYETEVKEGISDAILNENQKNEFSMLKSYCAKFKFLKTVDISYLGYVYVRKFKSWVKEGKEYLFYDRKEREKANKRDKENDYYRLSDFSVRFIGDGYVGKTSLLIRCCRGKWTTKYIPTIFDNCVAKGKFDGKDVKMSVWDTAGVREDERPLMMGSISSDPHDTNVYCFDICNPSSLKNCVSWMNEDGQLYWRLSETHHKVLCGCKCDLRKEKDVHGKKKDPILMNPRTGPISYDKILEVAKEMDVDCFVETSAKRDVNAFTKNEDFAEKDGGILSVICYCVIMRNAPVKMLERGRRKGKKGDCSLL